ncbi:MAG: peptidoglycan DD-metalloendopeptidase family protein [Woeseiaceae bacterium]
MKSDAQTMVGSARRLVPDGRAVRGLAALLAVLLVPLCVTDSVVAQELYKYRGENGEWIYSDRPPDDGQTAEVRELEKGSAEPTVDVTHSYVGSNVELTARNDFFAPVELRLQISSIRGLSYPDPDLAMVWVLPPRSETDLFELALLEDGTSPYLEYEFRYMPGDPDARHDAVQPYRAPFAISNDYPITQAYPQVVTHTGLDSYYAVDLAMPIGTDIFAARGGVVFDVAGTNFRAGQDIERDGPAANVVRILHDDGTYAIYAHLNTNTIRVKLGDRVNRGDYIADSGNTGYSTGPHLHFAVVRNSGLRTRSVPITFAGVNAESVTPVAGQILTAY